jgi:CHAT domain-containing protein
MKPRRAGRALFGALLLLACDESPPPVRPASPLVCREIPPPGGSADERPLGPEGLCYRIDAEAGDAIRLEIQQLGGDLVATVVAPDGELLLTYDTFVEDRAPERPCLVAETSGRHLLRLEADGPRARTAVRLQELRPATTPDRACAEAARRFMDASGRLRSGKTRELAEELTAIADLWRAAGDPLSEAMARREAAWTWRDLAEHGRAEEQLERTLVAAREADSVYLELSALNRLGVVLWYRGALEDAEAVLEQALTVAVEHGDESAQATALNNLSLIEEIRGHTTRAVRRLREAEAVQRTLDEPGDLALTLHNLAFDLALLDHHREALALLDEAESLARDAGSSNVLSDCLLTRGWIYRLQGFPRQAEAPLREALRIWKETGDVVGQAVALDRLGTVLREMGDLDAAATAFREALAIVPESTDPSDLAPTMTSLGCLYQQAGDAVQAESWLSAARHAYEGVEDPKSLSHLEYCSSLLAEDSDDLPKALDHIGRALEIVESIKEDAREQGARHQPIWLWQTYAERQTAQWLALAEKRADPALRARAFSAADYARARSLFELVWESQLPERRALVEEDDLRERLRELGESRRRAAAAGDVEEAARIERRAAAAALELEEQLAARRQEDPHFARLPPPQPVSVGQARALLVPGAALLRYFLAEPASFLFVLDRHALEVHPLASRTVLEAHAEALHRALRASSEDPEPAAVLARSTAEQLLPADAIPAGVHTLWVVPDGALHYVPFGALIPGDDDGGAPLIERYTLRFLPSAGVGVALRQRSAQRPATPRTVAVFADPVFTSDDNRLTGKVATAAVSSRSRSVAVERLPTGPLPRLPWTAAEAKSIFALVPDAERYSAVGFAAAKPAVLDPALRQYRILHFATHAFVDEELPELSGLVLSRYAVDGAEVDGNLYLHEIFGLRFDAELVVLSGCQTALGRKVRGDGLLGMTRGFFHAGASQVLVSLWSVDDEATAALMAALYEAHLREGRSVAESLRIAQQRMRREERWRAPYYWAAFVLQGIEPAR